MLVTSSLRLAASLSLGPQDSRRGAIYFFNAMFKLFTYVCSVATISLMMGILFSSSTGP